jgi:hypothetical protein
MIYNEASKPTALLFGANGNTFLFVSSTTLSARLSTTLRLLRRPQSDFGDPGSALNQFERWTVEERHSSGHTTATPEPLRVDIADRPIFITELQL